MNYILSFLIDFLVVFLLIFLVYFFYLKSKKKEFDNLKENDNVKSYIERYDLDIKKTNYKTILYVIAINNSLTIAFTVALIANIKGFAWKIVVSFVVLVILIYITNEISGRILKKKEGKNNVRVQKNRRKMAKLLGKK